MPFRITENLTELQDEVKGRETKNNKVNGDFYMRRKNLMRGRKSQGSPLFLERFLYFFRKSGSLIGTEKENFTFDF